MKEKTVSVVLREAVVGCGLNGKELAERSGVDGAAISRFINGKSGLTTASLDLLCAALKLELRPKRGARSKKGGR